MQNGWVLSKIISSEFFLPLVVGILGCLKVAGVITIGDVNSTANLLTSAILAIMTMVLGANYGIGRNELKKTAIESAPVKESPEVLG